MLSLLMQDSGKFILWNRLYLELPISGMWLIVQKLRWCMLFQTIFIKLRNEVVDTYILAPKPDTGVCWLISEQATFCIVPKYYELLIHEWRDLFIHGFLQISTSYMIDWSYNMN